MIRPFTCLCLVLAGASGLYLYQEKHRAQLLDRDITATVRATEAAQARSGVLRAEWMLQNDPERLAQFADRFLALKTVTPSQFTTLADLDQRLPPVPTPEAKPADTTDEGEPVAAAPETESPKVATATEPKPEPARREAAAPAPRPLPASRLASVASRPAERRAIPQQAASVMPARLVTSESRSMLTSLAPSTPRPAMPLYQPAIAAPVVTSVLGITRTSIAPPVPFAPQTGNGG